MLTLNDYLRGSDERPLGPSKDGRWFLFEWNDGLMTHKRRKKLHVKVYPALNVRAEWIEEKGQRFFLFDQFLGGRVAYDWTENRW